MKQILVCMKAVPVSAFSHQLRRESAALQWNPADEAALEAALRLAEPDGAVTVLTMGPAKLRDSLLELAARGAKRAVLISDACMAGADTHATALALERGIRKLGNFDAVFCGSKAMDGETGQVPGQLAAALSWPCITHAEKIEETDRTLHLTRRLEDGIQMVELSCPAVISFCSYCYPLRLAGIAGMRNARKMTVDVLDAKALGLTGEECGLAGSLTKVERLQSQNIGFRHGQKETEISSGVKALLGYFREVRP